MRWLRTTHRSCPCLIQLRPPRRLPAAPHRTMWTAINTGLLPRHLIAQERRHRVFAVSEGWVAREHFR
ncbi:protein of unknown function [Rhodovastum atsumiense]|nr:protein of unknown function [Rhodovastum atsumiense]